MMVLVALLRMPWSGTTVGLSKPEPPPNVLLWIMPHFLVLLVFWIALGVTSLRPPITQEDVAAWPHSNILLEFTSFLASLHWPRDGFDLGEYGISYFELLIMIELFFFGSQVTLRESDSPPPPS